MSFVGGGIAENFKLQHLRNAYGKVGMFDGERKVLRMRGPNSYTDADGVAYSSTQLRESAKTAGQELTFTCYPPS
jgi:hypothetical protein